MGEFLKKWVDKHVVELFPGLAAVIGTIDYIFKELRPQGTAEALPETFLYILICGFAVYVLGNSWDALLYDPLWSVPSAGDRRIKKLWWWLMRAPKLLTECLPSVKRLREARLAAGRKINSERAQGSDFGGLHQTAARLAAHTTEWEHNVEKSLHRSKVARSFLFPLLALTLYRHHAPDRPWPFHESVLSILWDWRLDMLLFLFAFVAYIRLRIHHVTQLYRLTAGAALNVTRDPNSGYVVVEYSIPEGEVPYLK